MKKPDFVITPMPAGQKSCCWCEPNDKNATYKVYHVAVNWMDYACEEHYQEHFRNR